MNRSSIILFILLIFLLVGGISVFWYVKNISNTKKTTNQDLLIFKRSEGWGPCPGGLTCQLDTYLYNSGRLSFVGDVNKEVQLDNKTIETVMNAIRKSGVFEKDCSGPVILDYSVEYQINIDGKVKHISIEDTGCRENMDETNKIIDSFYNVERKGGA